MKRTILMLLAVGACASSSPPMETADGSYIISASAAPARGGTTGAYTVAHHDAQQFCAQRTKRAVMVGADERDVYQGSAGAVWSRGSGGFGGGVAASGAVTVRFRCE